MLGLSRRNLQNGIASLKLILLGFKAYEGNINNLKGVWWGRLHAEKKLPYNVILEAIEIDARAFDSLDKNLTEIKLACRVQEIFRKRP